MRFDISDSMVKRKMIDVGYDGLVAAIAMTIRIDPLARIVADYTYIDEPMAAQILVGYKPVYCIPAIGMQCPAYLSIVPEEDNAGLSRARVELLHESDFKYKIPSWLVSYEEIAGFHCDEKSRGYEDTVYDPDEEPNEWFVDDPTRTVDEPGLSGELLQQLGRSPKYCPRLFAMIHQDMKTIIDCDVPYVSRAIPIKWPPTYEELLKKFD